MPDVGGLSVIADNFGRNYQKDKKLLWPALGLRGETAEPFSLSSDLDYKQSHKLKKQINPTIKAHLIRSAFYVLLLLAVCVIPFALAQSRSGETTKRSGAASVSPMPPSQLPTVTCLVVNGGFETGD